MLREVRVFVELEYYGMPIIHSECKNVHIELVLLSEIQEFILR